MNYNSNFPFTYYKNLIINFFLKKIGLFCDSFLKSHIPNVKKFHSMTFFFFLFNSIERERERES